MSTAGAEFQTHERDATAPTLRTTVLAACALAAVAFALVGAGNADDEERSPAPMALRPTGAQCADLDEPARRAIELEPRATARMARYAFVPRDGVTALQLLAEAVRCREHAGDATGAERDRVLLDAWLGRIDRDFGDHRLRLERARRDGRHADAWLECRALLSLLPAQADPYVAWLRRLSFELESAIEPTEEP